MKKAEEIISELKKHADKGYRKRAKGFGINVDNLLGVPKQMLVKIAKKSGKDQQLALYLWKSKLTEAKIVAAMIAEPEKMTEKQMESWVEDIDSWDVGDHVVGTLFRKTDIAKKKIHEWSKSEKEFVKRAGYVMIAELAVHSKELEDKEFEYYLKLIRKGADDRRNFVKKSVNWSLRQIGKRNVRLNQKAIEMAHEILKDEKSVKWIARDALRELKSKEVQRRLKKSGR